MNRVLLVFSPQDAEILKPIHAAFKRANLVVDVETTLKPLAERLRQNGFAYIVSGLHLAKDEDSPVRADGGFKLCAEVRKRSEVPLALIVPRIINEVQLRAAKIAAPMLLLSSGERGLAEQLLQHMRNVKPRPRRLEIVIRAEETRNWWYEMHGTGFAYHEPGILNTNAQLVSALKQLSGKLLDKPEKWYEAFSDLGKLIVGDLMDNNPDFKAHLDEGLKQAGNIENTRVTFSVPRVHYQIALEAIFRPDRLEPWMVHAPLVRSIHSAAPANGSLFEGAPERLRCLVICADTSGATEKVLTEDGQVTVLDELDTVGAESEKVCATLRAQRAHVRQVVALGGPGDKSKEPVTRDRLLNVLRDGDWDLVHYAGHSKFHHKDGKEQAGYLFVGEKDAPEPVEISAVAPRLRESKLLYLSSCESANAPFAAEAANNLIPAVIGFRWGLPDTEGERHARLFYKALFRTKAIDTAFWSVRKEIHDADRNNNTWASSVLMLR